MNMSVSISVHQWFKKLCLLIFLALAAAPATARQPNIVLIVADDLGWADVSYQAPLRYQTANIDRLAASGARFDRFYIGAANCAPSRATFLTGMYPPRHGVYIPQGLARGAPPERMRWNVPTRGQDPSEWTFAVSINQVDPSFVSIAEMLRSAGYATARLGKWHIGGDNQGFDLSSANGDLGFTTNRGPDERRYYSDTQVAERLTDAGIRFMEDNRDRPFFLYLSHWEVHTPIVAREERVAHFRERFAAQGRSDLDPVYAAEIEQVDNSVGRILDALEQLELASDTLVIFTSDNGGLSTITSNAPLRAGKGAFYEGGIRVPFCARWPGVIEPGSVVYTASHGVDFMPTFAELAETALPTDQPVDGASLVPLLKGEGKGAAKDRALFFHFPLYLGGGGAVLEAFDGTPNTWRAVPSSAIMRGDWKLIHYYEYDRSELFNLAQDPSESRDLSRDLPDKAHQLRAELETWINATNAPVPSIPRS